MSAASVEGVLYEMGQVCPDNDRTPFYRLRDYLRLKISEMRDLLDLNHQEAQFVALFADPRTIDSDIKARLEELMYDCPAASRMNPTAQGDTMMDTTKKWLYDLGRNPEYGQLIDLGGGYPERFAALQLGGTMSHPKADDNQFVLGGTSRPSKCHCTNEWVHNSA